MKQTAIMKKDYEGQHPWRFWAWNLGALLLSALGLGLLSLFLANGTYSQAVWASYFTNFPLLVLNLLPPVLLIFFVYFLCGRPLPSFLITSGLIGGLSVVNHYKLAFRDDPLMFEDFLHIREAMSIAGIQSYNMTPGFKVWLLIGYVLFVSVLMGFFVRGRLRKRTLRLPLAAVLLAGMILLRGVYASAHVYNSATRNLSAVDEVSATQVYISKGFLYPFLHSALSGGLARPEGYDKRLTEAWLSAYEDAAIPEDKKISLMTIQLEAFSDFSKLGMEGVDFSAYDSYHRLQEESITGPLVTNIFAGGTVDTERCFLTGLCHLPRFRGNTNSYAWYLQRQGYQTYGSHPCYQWFYNRQNVNRYLGLDPYYFAENHYAALTEESVIPDYVLFPELFRLLNEALETGRPALSFDVTYQGHGPYSRDRLWRETAYVTGDYSRETTYILNNYLGSLKDTSDRLWDLTRRLNELEQPVVLVVFGDHKPWLGDRNSVYQELGVNLDTSTKEGFLQYYATDYIIWANSAAQAVIGHPLQGEGERVSSCFLMNKVFSVLGWKGNAYMQATEEIRKTLPVITSVGAYLEGETLCAEDDLTPAAQNALYRFRCLEYYWAKHFAKGS